MQTYKTREEVADCEKWNLRDIYESEAAWDNDLEAVKEKITTLSGFNGKITNGTTLLAYLTLSEKVSYLYRKVYAYGMLLLDLDTRNTHAQSLIEKARLVGQKYSSATAFFMPYLLSLDEQELNTYIQEEEGLAYFEKISWNLSAIKNMY